MNWTETITEDFIQAYVEIESGFTLYLRWRYEDPFQGNIVQDIDTDNEKWTIDLLKYNEIEYTREEMEKGKEYLIRIYSQIKKDIENYC